MAAADTASGRLARRAWRWRRLQCWSSARRCCSCSICGCSSSCATCRACARTVAAGSTSAWLPVRLPWQQLRELCRLLLPRWSSARRCSCSICDCSSSCATCRACARAVAAAGTSAWLPVRRPWRRLCELSQLLPPCWSSAYRCCSYSICGCSSSCATCRACARAVAAAGTSVWLPVRRPWKRLCEQRRLLLPRWSIARRCRYPTALARAPRLHSACARCSYCRYCGLVFVEAGLALDRASCGGCCSCSNGGA